MCNSERTNTEKELPGMVTSKKRDNPQIAILKHISIKSDKFTPERGLGEYINRVPYFS